MSGEHISIIRAGCEHRGAGISGRTAGSRSARASARAELRFRACAPICHPPLALASRGLSRCALALIAALVAACGGDGGGGNNNGPHLIAGGGVSNAPIDGTLSVYVVEVDSSTPIANATVRVGSAMAMTDATGLATFMVSGPQTISASASGHAGVTWVGVQGSNVTLPLEPTPHNPPTAKASGTIAGWDQLPSPPFGHYNLAVVIYSFLDDPTAAENRLTQGNNGGTPTNTCIDTTGSTACNWQLVTRTGMQVHTAVILDGDAHGTQDPADDTYSVIGFAAGTPMMMTAGQNLTNESLAMVTATTTVSAQVPAAPAGLPKVTAIPELAIGDAGRIVFPLPGITPSSSSVEVMAAMGSFAGSFHIVAVAAPQTGSLPYSTSFATGAQATLPAWLSPPTGLTGSNATFTFGASSGANLYTAQIAKSDMAPLWNVTVLDGSNSFPIPENVAGAATATVTAADVTGLDVTNFTVGDVKTKLARAAGAQIPFTR